MATNETLPTTLPTLLPCTGCRSTARINLTNYIEVEHFDDTYTVYRIHCGECCTDPIGTFGTFEALAEDQDVCAKRWNTRMLELRQEELEYETGLLGHPCTPSHTVERRV